MLSAPGVASLKGKYTTILTLPHPLFASHPIPFVTNSALHETCDTLTVLLLQFPPASFAGSPIPFVLLSHPNGIRSPAQLAQNHDSASGRCVGTSVAREGE